MNTTPAQRFDKPTVPLPDLQRPHVDRETLLADLNTTTKNENNKCTTLFNRISKLNQDLAGFQKMAHQFPNEHRQKVAADARDLWLEKSNLYQDVLDSLTRTDDAYRNAGFLPEEAARAKLGQDIKHYSKLLEQTENEAHHYNIIAHLLPKQEPQPFMIIGEGHIEGLQPDDQITSQMPVIKPRSRADRDTITDPHFSPLARRTDELEELPSDAIKTLPPSEDDLEELHAHTIKTEEPLNELPELPTENILPLVDQPKEKRIKLTRTLSGSRMAHVLTSTKPYKTDFKFVEERVPEMFPQETAKPIPAQPMPHIELKPATWKEQDKTLAEFGIDESRARVQELHEQLKAYGNRVRFNDDGTATFARAHERFTSLFSKKDNELRPLIRDYNKAMMHWHKFARSHEQHNAGQRAAERIQERATDTDTYASTNLLPVDLHDIEAQKFYYDRTVEAARAKLEPFAKPDEKFPAVVEFAKDGSARFRGLSSQALARWSASHPDVAALVQNYNKLRAQEIQRADDVVRGYGNTIAELTPPEREKRAEAQAAHSKELHKADTLQLNALEQKGTNALARALVFDDIAAQIKNGSARDADQVVAYVQRYLPDFNPNTPLQSRDAQELTVQNKAQRLLSSLTPRQKTFAQSLTKFKSPFSSVRVFDATSALKTVEAIAVAAHNESRLILQKIPTGRAEKLTQAIRGNYSRRSPLRTVVSFGGG